MNFLIAGPLESSPEQIQSAMTFGLGVFIASVAVLVWQSRKASSSARNCLVAISGCLTLPGLLAVGWRDGGIFSGLALFVVLAGSIPVFLLAYLISRRQENQTGRPVPVPVIALFWLLTVGALYWFLSLLSQGSFG